MSLFESIKAFCRENSLRLNTDLGQHFLVDQDVLDAIIDAADIEEQDQIVEIGPGIGILTKELLECTEHVTAIEIDERMPPLIEKYTNTLCHLERRREANLAIVQGNALQVPMPNEKYKVVANIPYHITSPLLRHVFIESDIIPTSLTLLIQKEVAQRICDPKNASLLTILVGLFGKAHIVCSVPPESFLPPPKVDSAVIHIDCYEKPLVDEETFEEIAKLTKAAFAGKRKKLSNTLGAFHGGIERLNAAGIDENRRPQTLSIEEWIALAQTK